MKNKGDGWSSPANILTIFGLCISLAGNVILWQQNNTAKLQIQKETLRADILQKHKDSWLRLMKRDLDDTKKKIDLIRQRITLTRQEIPAHDFNGQQRALARIESDVAMLGNLEAEKNRLESQFSQLVEP